MTTPFKIDNGKYVELEDGLIGKVVSYSNEKLWKDNQLKPTTWMVLETSCGLVEVNNEEVAKIL